MQTNLSRKHDQSVLKGLRWEGSTRFICKTEAEGGTVNFFLLSSISHTTTFCLLRVTQTHRKCQEISSAFHSEVPSLCSQSWPQLLPLYSLAPRGAAAYTDVETSRTWVVSLSTLLRKEDTVVKVGNPPPQEKHVLESVLQDASVCPDPSSEFRGAQTTTTCSGPLLGFHCSSSFPPEPARRNLSEQRRLDWRGTPQKGSGSFDQR